jgi:DNA-directed RNA polymerase subunit RPC12/RpoP
MIKFKGDETVYRCLVCEAVVSSRELDQGDGID